MELTAENSAGISARARDLGWIGPDESITRLASAGEGNMNRTLRADTGARTVILKQSVPFVAKYPQIPAPEDRIDVEARFYGAIADQPALSQRVPRVLGYDPDNRLLCLEDLGPGRDFTDMYQQTGQGQKPDQRLLEEIVRWLSALHALAITPDRLPDGLSNHPMRALNHEHIFEIPLDPDNGLSLDPGLGPIAAEFAADTRLGEAARRLGQVYLGHTGHESPVVLLHGDFYPGSWLRDAALGASIIDPEFAFLGPPEFDVGVLLAHLTMCGYPPAERSALLRAYTQPPGFEPGLAAGFTGMEIIRRLLGVAQLPLSADLHTRLGWLSAARDQVLAAIPGAP